MASRIKGITIEINGDVTKLVRAMKGVDSTLKANGRNLQDVNKLLKLDPSNTELLKQKQEYLAKAIDSTKEKIQKEKEALEQMKNTEGFDKSSEQAKALERQIIADEKALKELEKEAKSLPSAFQAGMQEAGAKVTAVGKKIKSVGEGITGAGKSLTAATAPITALGVMGVKSFADVDKTMQLTNKTMKNSKEDADLLNKAMKEAAANSTFGMSDAATASLNFARAGLSAKEAAAALAPAMNLAAGEGGNLDTVSGGLVATINGFHGSFDEVGRYADVFAAACNNSALDVDSLSNAMSVAAPIFSAAGYSVEDASLYLGVMADNGIEANKAANSLKTGLARLVSPAKDGAEKMAELGISVTNADGTMKDSVQVQQELHEAFSSLSESEQIAAASAIFGKNQMAPWLALIRTAPEDVSGLMTELQGASISVESFAEQLKGSGTSYDEIKAKLEKLGISGETVDEMLKTSKGDAGLFVEGLHECADAGVTMGDIMDAVGGSTKNLQDAMDGAKGTTEEMADAMMSGFGGSAEKLKSSMDVMATSIGEALAPTIQKVVDLVQGLVDKFNALDPEQQQMIATIGLVVAAIGPALVIIGTLISSIGSIVAAIGGVIAIIGAPLFGPILLIMAAVAAAIAIGIELYRNWDTIKAKAKELVESVQEKWQKFKEDTAEKFRSVKEDALQKVHDMKEGAKQKAEDMRDGVLQKIEDLKVRAAQKVQALKDEAIQKVQDLKDGAVQKFQDLKDGAVQKVQDLKDGAAQKVQALKDEAIQKVQDLKDGAVQKFQDLKDGAVQKVQDLKDGAAQKVQDLKDAFEEKFGGIAEKVESAMDGIQGFIEDPIGSAVDFVKNAVEDIKNAFNFDWNLPELKLPHIHVGSYIDIPVFGTIPNPDDISIEWYDKAMNRPMLLDRATIFGASGGQLLGGGESGPEVVSGLGSLLGMIQQAVRSVQQATNITHTVTYGDINVSVQGAEGQDVNELADRVADKIKEQMRREEAVYA